jgi:eukaryotic-like serine/threonine-protein kinase
MIGSRLGRNLIVEKLGEGGMGAVYLGHDEHLARNVAIKILPAEVLAEESARRRFRKEALALSRLNHPNIEAVYDFDNHEGRDYLTMEYVPGVTLAAMLAQNPLSEKEITRLGCQIAEGLAAAHDKGIVHCDLKPGNLMITPDGRLKILDFGLAQLVHPQAVDISTDSSTLPRAGGTLPYMAPEQLMGEPVDPRTDIYAAGNILYEMATKRRPFQEQLPTALVNDIVHNPPPPPSRFRPELSPRLDEIILKCLEKDPENRYQSSKELLVDLRRSASSEPGAGPRGGRRRDRKRTLAIELGLILGAAGVILALRFWNRDRMPDYETAQVTSTTEWEGEPVLSPQGTRIAYSSTRAGNLDIYLTDVDGGAQVALTDDPADDNSPAWYPDGSALAFTSNRGGRTGIWKVSQTGGAQTILVEDALQPAISEDGSRIAFVKAMPNGRYRVAVAPLANPAEEKTLTGDIELPWGTLHPAWSPDGHFICYSGRKDLWTVPSSGGAPVRLTTDDEFDAEAVWAPDGRHIYFSSYRLGPLAIWRIRAAGGRPERITTGTGRESHPSISRDGRMLVCGTDRTSRQMVLLDRKSGERRVLPGLGWDMAAIAPDGRKVVTMSDRPQSDSNLWIQTLEEGAPSGPPQRLTDQAGVATFPAFSPDGQWVAYSWINGEQSDIWIISALDGRCSRLTESAGSDLHPAWSPDGNSIAFVSNRSGASQVWAAPVRDGKPAGVARQLTKGDFTPFSPAWSPDGASVAFGAFRNRENEVWIVSADGSAQARQLTLDADVRWRVRWDWGSGDLLVSGLWGEDRVTLRRVSSETGASRPFQPEVVFGAKQTVGIFDTSRDGRWLVFSRENVDGDIWLLKARKTGF